METSQISVGEKKLVLRAIAELNGIGLSNPTISQIKSCMDGLRKGYEFSERWIESKKKSLS